jgi:succinoglycan biosynthesis transport protein ExoP
VIKQQEIPVAPSRFHALEPLPEQPIDVERYINALRRSRLLIVAIVLALTGIVLVLSLTRPRTYTAAATILFDESARFTPPADTERQLATIQKLLMTRPVLARAARSLPGESATTLAGKVHASVDPRANIVLIGASAASPERAARMANAVARAFLSRERAAELMRAQAARARLTNAIAQLRGSPGAKAQIALIRERLSELSVSEATAGSDLQLADAARPPTAADSPRPLRNGLFAFVAALFIAVLAALGRERIAPRVGDARELERLSGLPILTELPRAGGRRLGAGAASPDPEAYEALAAIVAAQLTPRRQQILLVTSAAPDDGKPPVAAGLSRALAQAGETALVVDADLRRPSLEQLFGMERAPGLAEILAAARHGDKETAAGMIIEPPASASPRRRTGSLAVLGAGESASPALATPDALEIFFDELRQSGFTYVVIHAPPLREPGGCRAWARHVDAALLVSRPERLSPGDVVELREQLEQVDATVLGHVVIGGRSAS